MSPGVRSEEGKQHVTIYTSSYGYKKRKERGRKKYTHTDSGRCAFSSLGLLVEKG